jgi:hypothetical protein
LASRVEEDDDEAKNHKTFADNEWVDELLEERACRVEEDDDEEKNKETFVYYISEHRGAFPNKEELPDISYPDPDYVLFPISITRFASQEVAKELFKEYGIKVSVHHVFKIKPFKLASPSAIQELSVSRFGGCVLDDDYVDGIAKSIGYDLAQQSGTLVDVLGLENKSAGFSPKLDNLPPSKEKIKEFILGKVKRA